MTPLKPGDRIPSLILSAHESRGLLDGTVSVLVRPVVPRPPRDIYDPTFGERGDLWSTWEIDGVSHGPYVCPFGHPGGVVLGKEAWCAIEEGIIYRADGARVEWADDFHVDERDGWLDKHGENWRSPAHLPDWAVRHRPTIAAVKAVRCAEITEYEAQMAGYRLTVNVSDPMEPPIERTMLEQMQADWSRRWPRSPWDESWAWVAKIGASS